MAVKAPSDKRFKRARVRAPRRQRNWRRWVVPVLRTVAVLAATAYVTDRAIALVTRAPALRIRHVAVQGTKHLAPNEVTARLKGLIGQNILRADLEVWRERLLQDPWIRQATLRRSLPRTVEVAVVEREPIGIGRVSDRLFLVAADGMTLAQGSALARYDLPLVDGLHNGPITVGEYVDTDRAALAASVVRSLRQSPDLDGRVSQIDVSDDEDAVVLLADEATRVHLGSERFSERLRAYLDLAPALRARVPTIDYVDLRFDSRVFVRPLGKEGREGRR
jgi:cell division septal protein FtsQ